MGFIEIHSSITSILRTERESETAQKNLSKEIPVITVTLCLICSAQTSWCYYPCIASVSLPQGGLNTKAYSFGATTKIDLAIKLMTGKRLDKLM